MKIKYNVKPIRGQYQPDRFFTYGKEYNVIADYTKRTSGQQIPDNGYVVIDNNGQHNMLFKSEVLITDNSKGNTFVFEYSKN